MWLPTFLQRGIHFFGERTEVLAFNNFVLFDRVHLPIIGSFLIYLVHQRAKNRIYRKTDRFLSPQERVF